MSKAPTADPEIVELTPVFGLRVTVFEEVGKLFAIFIIIGNVSPVVYEGSTYKNLTAPLTP